MYKPNGETMSGLVNIKVMPLDFTPERKFTFNAIVLPKSIAEYSRFYSFLKKKVDEAHRYLINYVMNGVAFTFDHEYHPLFEVNSWRGYQVFIKLRVFAKRITDKLWITWVYDNVDYLDGFDGYWIVECHDFTREIALEFLRTVKEEVEEWIRRIVKNARLILECDPEYSMYMILLDLALSELVPYEQFARRVPMTYK